MNKENEWNAKGIRFFLVLLVLTVFFPVVNAGLFCQLTTDSTHECDGPGPKGGPIVIIYKSIPVGNCSPELSCDGVCAPVPQDGNVVASWCMCQTVEVDRFELNPNCCSVEKFDSCRCDARVLLPLLCLNGQMAPSCNQAEAESYCAGFLTQKPRKINGGSWNGSGIFWGSQKPGRTFGGLLRFN